MDSSTHLWHPSPSDRWTRYGIAGGLLLLAVGGIAYGVRLEQNRGLGELDDPGKILIVDNEAQYLARWASHQPLHGTHRETLDFLAELDSAPETEPTSLAQILEQADRAGIGYVAISQEACQALGTAGCDDAKLQESSDPAFWAVFPVGDLAIGEVASYAVLPQSVQVRSHLRKRIGLMQAVHAQPLIQHFVTQSWASDLPARPDIRRSPTQKEVIVGGVALQQLNWPSTTDEQLEDALQAGWSQLQSDDQLLMSPPAQELRAEPVAGNHWFAATRELRWTSQDGTNLHLGGTAKSYDPLVLRYADGWNELARGDSSSTCEGLSKLAPTRWQIDTTGTLLTLRDLSLREFVYELKTGNGRCIASELFQYPIHAGQRGLATPSIEKLAASSDFAGQLHITDPSGDAQVSHPDYRVVSTPVWVLPRTVASLLRGEDNQPVANAQAVLLVQLEADARRQVTLRGDTFRIPDSDEKVIFTAILSANHGKLLVIGRQQANYHLWQLDATRPLHSVSPKYLRPLGPYADHPVLSADGKWLVYEAKPQERDQARRAIFGIELGDAPSIARRPAERLALAVDGLEDLAISSDGTQVIALLRKYRFGSELQVSLGVAGPNPSASQEQSLALLVDHE